MSPYLQVMLSPSSDTALQGGFGWQDRMTAFHLYMFSDGIDYWKAKNTAGTGWGDEGYFKVIRGKGHCGIGSFWMQPICSSFWFPISNNISCIIKYLSTRHTGRCIFYWDQREWIYVHNGWNKMRRQAWQIEPLKVIICSIISVFITRLMHR